MAVKLGVIISSYNRPKFLKEAIESIVKQTIVGEISVVVVDDWSAKQTVDVANSFLDSNPFYDYKVINNLKISDDSERINTNRVAMSVNQGLRYFWSLSKEHRPEYLSYLGDDDLYFSNRCEKMVNFLDENLDVFLVYHFMEIHQCDGDGNLTRKLLDLNEEWNDANKFWVEHLYNRIDHISFVHRDKNYLWDEDEAFRRASDWGFLLRALSIEEKFAHLPEYLAQGRKIKGDSLNIDGKADLRSKLSKEGDEDGK